MTPDYLIVWHPPASCERHIRTKFNPSTVKVISWYLRSDVPLHDWLLGRRSICYINYYLNVYFSSTLPTLDSSSFLSNLLKRFPPTCACINTRFIIHVLEHRFQFLKHPEKSILNELPIYLPNCLSIFVELSWLGLYDTSTAFLHRASGIGHLTIWWWGYINAGAMGNVDPPFIAIAPRFTIARSGSKWLGPIYGSNRTLWHLNWAKKMTYVKPNC